VKIAIGADWVKAILIYGLCGSGKSHLAAEIQKQTGAPIFESAEQWGQWPKICLTLMQGNDCIIEEITMSYDGYRQRILWLLRSYFKT
jgi:hypothetical protein